MPFNAPRAETASSSGVHQDRAQFGHFAVSSGKPHEPAPVLAVIATDRRLEIAHAIAGIVDYAELMLFLLAAMTFVNPASGSRGTATVA